LIEVYVNRLRRKIDSGEAKPLLQTRRGAGYLLSSAEAASDAGAAEKGGQRASRSKAAGNSGRKEHA